MGFRFRNSIRLAPGVRLNIGKKGMNSLSVGGRGVTLNVGKDGTRVTVGLPGTGMSYSTKLSADQLNQYSIPTALPKSAASKSARVVIASVIISFFVIVGLAILGAML